MDKTLIKLKAIRDAFEGEGFDSSCELLDDIIGEVEFKNTVLDDYLSEIEILNRRLDASDVGRRNQRCLLNASVEQYEALKKEVKELNEILDPTPEKGTREALDKLTVRGER